MAKHKVASVDFDGVIHQYGSGWQKGIIYDKPVKGAKEGLKELKNMGYRIIIFSTRTNPMYRKPGEPEQLPQIEAYMKKHDLVYDEIWTGKGKPMATVYLDDRSIPFRGNWLRATSDIEDFEVWNKTSTESN